MAKKRKRVKKQTVAGRDRRLEPQAGRQVTTDFARQGARLPTKAEADSARARTRRRTTKSKGLKLRERELTAARRELSTIRGTGVARRGQSKKAEDEVARAERALERQRKSARRTGRRVN